MATRVIGVVGGIASGKSTVAGMLAELGAWRLDADRMAHEALKDPVVRAAVLERWGEEVIDEQGEIDRKAVAARVFGDSNEAVEGRRFLEQLLHPVVRRDAEQAILEANQESTPAVVVDAPLLLEAGWGPLCDEIVFVEAPREIRQSRAAARGWTTAEFNSREAAQLPIEEKRSVATKVFEDLPLDELANAVRKWWQSIVGT